MKLIYLTFLLVTIANTNSCTQKVAETNQSKPHSDATHLSFLISENGDTIQKIIKSESEWREILSPTQYYVLREKGTEKPFTGQLLTNKKSGTYVCNACKLPLFSSDTKFDSGTGWPSFFAPIHSPYVFEEQDNSLGMKRVEALCARCGGHLGHIFEDGPKPTGLRYCINSVSLDFIEKEN